MTEMPIQEVSEHQKTGPTEQINEEELEALIDTFKHRLDEREDELYDADASRTDIAQMRQEELRAFHEQLLQNPDYFGRVFTTSNGSSYFVARDGIALRFKQEENGTLVMSPLVRQFLISSSLATHIRENYIRPGKQEDMIGVAFEKAPYEIGSQPFEIGRYGPEVKVEEDETSFRILGDETGGNSNGLHIGHAITEITK